MIDDCARQIRNRPKKSVLALTMVHKGMFTSEILEKLKVLTKGNEPFIRKSAVVGVENGVYRVAMSHISTASKRQFKICKDSHEALQYLLGE